MQWHSPVRSALYSALRTSESPPTMRRHSVRCSNNHSALRTSGDTPTNLLPTTNLQTIRCPPTKQWPSGPRSPQTPRCSHSDSALRTSWCAPTKLLRGGDVKKHPEATWVLSLGARVFEVVGSAVTYSPCLLYTSDAADDIALV